MTISTQSGGRAVLDLFSAAAGGWSLGLHRAGFRTVAACEWIEWRRALYAENNPGVLIYDDVRTLTGERLLADLGTLPDIVVGSPPCQDISSANTKGKGVDGEKSVLFFDAIRIIGEIKALARQNGQSGARWIALENSDRVRTRGYDRIATAMEAHDYPCWPLVVGVGNAGGSHQRKRSWIIGMDAYAESAQGRLAGQSWLDADPDSPEQQIRRCGTWGRGIGGAQACGGPRDTVGADADQNALRVERGAGPGREADGKEAVVAGLSRVFRGPVGSADLSCHLRAYDGVSAGVAEQCREAYGDAVSPQITEAIGRAILRVEAALAAVSTSTRKAA